MGRRSTDTPRAVPPRPLVPNALRVAWVNDGLFVPLAARLGVPAKAGLVRAALVDPERTARALAKASGASLAVLEAVAGAGGQISEAALVTLLDERFGWKKEQALGALHEASMACLVVHAGVTQSSWYVAMVAEVAEQIAEATFGISLPPTPDLPIPPASTTSLRDRIARLAATAHFAVKATRDGDTPNRATLRRLAVAVGMEESRLHDELTRALALHALYTEGDLIVPNARVLSALGSGRLAWDDDYTRGRLRAWIPEDRWISEEAIVRATSLEALRVVDVPIWSAPSLYFHTGVSELDAARRTVAACEGVVRIEHEGHAFLRRASPEAREGGDGHVTPSMEVMLGPDASVDLTLTIALAAEPVRFDRVLTFKLTPASVSAAVSQGIDAPTLLSALGQVGRHGVAENVRAMVTDWMRSARTARVQAVWAVELSTPEAADVAGRALGRSVVARPTPTLLLVDQSVATPEIALAKVGVKVSAARDPVDVPSRAKEVAVLPSRVLALTPRPEVVSRFGEARRAGFPVAKAPAAAAPSTKASFPSKARSRARGTPHFDEDAMIAELEGILGQGLSGGPPPPWEVLLDRADEEPIGVIGAMLELAGELVQTAGEDLLDWMHELPIKEQALAFSVAAESPLCLAPFAALTPRWRLKLLRENRTITGLVRESERYFDVGHTTDKGARLLAGLGAAAARALWDEDRTALASEPEAARALPASAPLGAKPKPRELARQPSEEVRRALDEATASGSAVWALVSSKSQGDRIVSLRVERVLARGADVVVLGTDLEAEEGRSFPLANVVAVRPQARPSAT